MKSDKIETIEDALFCLGERIASIGFSDFVRECLVNGENVKYELTIKKSNQSGYVVALDFKKESPKKSLSAFIRLQ